MQQQPVAGVLVDGDAQPRRLVADPDRVAAGHLDERRDVERLVHRVDEGRSRPAVPRRRVQVPLAVRVVDLDDDDPQVAGRVPAQEEAGRVEDVAQDPEVGHERDLPAVRVDALASAGDRGPRAQVVGRRVEVVLVAERQQVRPAAADRPEPARHLVELVEVERDVEHAVLEGVRERPDAPVPHDAFEQVRPHAARSMSAAWTSSAASQPDRQPSSWKP